LSYKNKNHDDEETEMVDNDTNGTHGRLWVHSFNETSSMNFANRVFDIAGRSPSEPIICYIDSYGGAIDGLSTMLSAVDAVPNQFITIATGKACSAGAVLLSHGDARCVGAYCRVMVHMASGVAAGHVDDAQTDMEELTRLNTLMIELLAKNCNKTVKYLKNILAIKRDVWMNAEEAVKFGIADQIGIPMLSRAVEVHGMFHYPASSQPVPKKTRKGKKR
jgi:ATP-dependent Clp protease protease subunit